MISLMGAGIIIFSVHQVDLLRSRQSIFSTTPRKKPSLQSDAKVQSNSGSEVVCVLDIPFDDEREQRLIYLKQAFCGFFKAKQEVEMQHLGRVICAILGVTGEEQATIMDSICRITPALVATSSLEMLSNNIYNSLESLFS